jgi:hypothetical protein
MSTRIPKYRLHAASGQARVILEGHAYSLGKHDTPESQALYGALIQGWRTKTGRFAPPNADGKTTAAVPTATSVNEVILAYVKHAEQYYASNPKEVEKVKLSARPLRRLYGRSPAATFDSLALEAVQEAMIDDNLARSTVNERVRVLKRMFKWSVRKKMVPATVQHIMRHLDSDRTDPSGSTSRARIRTPGEGSPARFTSGRRRKQS